MQNQVARCVLAPRVCTNVAACMPSLSSFLSTLSFPLSDALRPTEALPNFPDFLTAVQPLSWQNMSQRAPLIHIDRHICSMDYVPVRPSTYTPCMPVQLQAGARAAQVQKLASIDSVQPELEDPPPGMHIEDMLCATKRTYQPSVIIRKRRHGFLSRVSTRGGRNVMKRRKAKGRHNITA